MITNMKEQINTFFESKNIALTGFSRKPHSHSRSIYNSLVEKGFNVFPVNSNQTEIDGIKVYTSINELPNDIEAIYILNSKENSETLAREAAQKGIRKIWVHTKCNTNELKAIENQYGIAIVMGECFFMWAEPVKGVHSFHRFIRNLFGGHRMT
jgi:hypothetical protein